MIIYEQPMKEKAEHSVDSPRRLYRRAQLLKLGNLRHTEEIVEIEGGWSEIDRRSSDERCVTEVVLYKILRIC